MIAIGGAGHDTRLGRRTRHRISTPSALKLPSPNRPASSFNQDRAHTRRARQPRQRAQRRHLIIGPRRDSPPSLPKTVIRQRSDPRAAKARVHPTHGTASDQACANGGPRHHRVQSCRRSVGDGSCGFPFSAAPVSGSQNHRPVGARQQAGRHTHHQPDAVRHRGAAESPTRRFRSTPSPATWVELPAEAIPPSTDVIFHLAAVVSAQAEGRLRTRPTRQSPRHRRRRRRLPSPGRQAATNRVSPPRSPASPAARMR